MTHPGLDVGPAFGGRVELDFLAGLLAGLASSAHCLVMCGGIAAAIAVTGGRGGAARRAGVVAQASLARALVYVALGAAAGAVGWGFHEAGPPALMRTLARYVSALILAVAALTVLEIPLFGGRVGAFAARIASPLTRRLHRLHRFGPLGLGLAWGLVPCAMVYLATFYAGLTGSAAQGALVMAGFGLGTAPAVIAAGAGAGALRSYAKTAAVRWTAAVLLFGIAALTAIGV
ncbi:MAG: sulfite exporter TauE/SafE family protein [Oceanicaulis sp.]